MYTYIVIIYLLILMTIILSRVNGAISNNEDFSTIFKCSQGSKMNPQKKCHLF